jgi:phage terminase small subunit
MAGKKQKKQKKEASLNPKQERFAQEYIIDYNATQAAIRAGYSEKTAGSQAHDLLKKPEIQAAVLAAQAEQRKRLAISQDWALNRFRQISDRCIQAEPVLSFDKATGEWVPTGEYKFDSAGANRATELIAKHLGMFVDKVEHTGSISIEQALKELETEAEKEK